MNVKCINGFAPYGRSSATAAVVFLVLGGVFPFFNEIDEAVNCMNDLVLSLSASSTKSLIFVWFLQSYQMFVKA
jgi:hypothetical protein